MSGSRTGRPAGVLAGLVAALLVATLAAACSTGGGGTGELSGTFWTALSIDGTATIEQARPTIRFAPDGTVGGTSGCNQFSGPYRVDGGAIDIGELASTKVACDEERMTQESTFLSALAGATSWRRNEAGELELSGAGDIVLRAG